MMLGALARAYSVLGDEAYRQAAERNLAFIQAQLWDPGTHTLYHRWRDGARDSVQLLNAYANLLAGTLDLYEATLEPRHLQFATDLAQTMLAKFYDSAHGSFFQAETHAPDLILQVKEEYDGAEPSGNSVAALALLRLSAITDRQDFKDAAEKTLRFFADRLQHEPQAVPHLLLALNFWIEEPKRVVIAGDVTKPDALRLLHAAHSVYQPNKVVLGTSGLVEPLARTLVADQGHPAAFLCTATACQAPTSDPDTLKRLLKP
jgi:uncharacterized protein YyaL (SSP411 family)